MRVEHLAIKIPSYRENATIEVLIEYERLKGEEARINGDWDFKILDINFVQPEDFDWIADEGEAPNLYELITEQLNDKQEDFK